MGSEGTDSLLAELRAASEAFHDEGGEQGHLLSDREMVIVAGAFLDGVLERLLSASTADVLWKKTLFEGQGPLATFSARIDIACAIGVVPESVRRDLHLVRKVRNHFAHRVVGCSLSDRPVSQWMETTSVYRFGADAAQKGRWGAVTPRDRFRDCITMLGGLLQGCVGRVTPVKGSEFDLVRVLELEEARADEARTGRKR